MTIKELDVELLETYIKNSGLKIGYICEQLDISRQAFAMKRRGEIQLKGNEVKILCDLLRIPKKDKTKIFYPVVEKYSTKKGV